MANFTNSKKYAGVQFYLKANGYKTFYIRFKDATGKTKRIKVGDEEDGTTEIYCKNKRIEIINAITKGEQPPKLVKHAQCTETIYTLDMVAENFFASKPNTTSTYDRKGKYFKHLSPAFGSMPIGTIKKKHLEDLRDSMINDKQLSNQTVNLIIELFSSIFNYGFKEELYEFANPAKKISRFKVQNRRERFLKRDEIEQLFEAVKEFDLLNNTGNLLELFVKLAVTTGARTEAILNIKKSDVDMQTEIIQMSDFKKGGETYRTYVTKTSRPLLAEQMKRLNYHDHLVCFNHDGQKVGIRQIQIRLKKILDHLFNRGLDIKDRKNRIVIHSLRHTYASQLAISDTSIYIIKEMLNHSDLRQTERYAKLQDDTKKRAVQDVF